MTAVTNAPNTTWAFATPTPRYPLLGVARSSRVFLAVAVADDVVSANFVRTWGGANPDVMFHNQSDEQTLFPPRNLAAQVVLDDGGWPFDIHVAAVMNRQWNGIGGIGYLPSFPQLDRHNTTWPHAS